MTYVSLLCLGANNKILAAIFQIIYSKLSPNSKGVENGDFHFASTQRPPDCFKDSEDTLVSILGRLIRGRDFASESIHLGLSLREAEHHSFLRPGRSSGSWTRVGGKIVPG